MSRQFKLKLAVGITCIIVIMCCFQACGEAIHPDNLMRTIEYDGCEYVYTTGHVDKILHKGNCKNPIHQTHKCECEIIEEDSE